MQQWHVHVWESGREARRWPLKPHGAVQALLVPVDPPIRSAADQ